MNKKTFSFLLTTLQKAYTIEEEGGTLLKEKLRKTNIHSLLFLYRIGKKAGCQ
jgi:hypothetical protein